MAKQRTAQTAGQRWAEEAQRGNREICPTTDKEMLSSRKEARQTRARTHRDVSVYKCGDCGHFHLGQWHGHKDHDIHRKFYNGEVVDTSEVSLRMAAEALGMTVTRFGQLIDAGVADARRGDKGRWRIRRNEIERLKTLNLGETE